MKITVDIERLPATYFSAPADDGNRVMCKIVSLEHYDLLMDVVQAS